MKIIQFTAENIKKLKAVSIRPDGTLVLVTGANAQGKSSVLDAIFMALGGSKAIPSQPVRHGMEKAYVKLDLGELIVTRKFTANGGTSLTVEAANGSKFPSPQSMLDGLLGALAFDPLEFSRMAPKQQLETLRELVKLDVDIDALDVETKKLYDQRTVINRDVKSLQARQPAMPAQPWVEEEVKIGRLVSDLGYANQTNNERKIALNAIADRNRYIEEKNRQIDKLRRELESAEQDVSNMRAGLALITVPEAVDTTSIKKQVDEAEGKNVRHRELLKYKALATEIEDKQKEAGDLEAKLQFNQQLRTSTIASAKMPVEGLAFGDGEILFNNVPWCQLSAGEQIKISLAMAMEGNPGIRIIRIKEGSLLDESNPALVECMAAEKDFQVWIEKVDSSGSMGIVIEDGSVVSA